MHTPSPPKPLSLGTPSTLAFQLARRSFRHFLEINTVDSLPEPRPFGTIAQPWQWEKIYNPIIPAVEWMTLSDKERAERPAYAGPHVFAVTRGRGHDKTSTAARCITYMLVWGRRPIPLRISAAAADRTQAKLIRDAIERERILNPWYGDRIEINKFEVKGPGGTLIIVSADAGSAYGGNDDVILCDEITHWRTQDLWVALFSGSIKRQHNLTLIFTNAGYQRTWQWELFQQFRNDPDCYVYDEPGFSATWMRPDKLQQIRDNIVLTTGSSLEAQRLIDNLWVTSQLGSAFAPELISAMTDPHALLWAPGA